MTEPIDSFLSAWAAAERDGDTGKLEKLLASEFTVAVQATRPAEQSPDKQTFQGKYRVLSRTAVSRRHRRDGRLLPAQVR